MLISMHAQNQLCIPWQSMATTLRNFDKLYSKLTSLHHLIPAILPTKPILFIIYQILNIIQSHFVYVLNSVTGIYYVVSVNISLLLI